MSLWSNPYGTSSSSSSYYYASTDRVKAFSYFYEDVRERKEAEEVEENEAMPKELITFDPKDLRL